MPIKWKSSQRFKPALVLENIDAARTVNSSGGASFSGFDWEECLPALHSMLNFPAAASEIDTTSLVWKALTKVRGSLTPHDFLRAANLELNALLATKDESYRVLTTISISQSDTPATISYLGSKIRFLSGSFPGRYRLREKLIRGHFTNVQEAPVGYTRVIVSVDAQSHRKLPRQADTSKVELLAAC